jgi:DNA-binding transcriptional ArsR family regulator
MTAPGFDELIHAPTRLSLVAFLAATGWADFTVLRDSLGLSDSALSKQLATLEGAGYVEIRKAFAGKRPRTSARLTPGGRTAFDRHVLALQEIVAGTAGRWPRPGGRSAAPDGAFHPDQRFPGQTGQGSEKRTPAQPRAFVSGEPRIIDDYTR